MNALLLLACALLAHPVQDRRQPFGDDAVALRAQGPPALERLLERYDGLAPGAEKDFLGQTIDAVAGQRYATVSRLYWYTDLAAAKAAARASGKPILSLRMLGRLDEDLSCANSRLFRVVLYANADLSRFLRESFVLYWSSERLAPRLSIDFGDGRRIETTIAGNSAHYVLDQEGRPIDVLPGMYSPVAFRRGLEAVLPLARESPFLTDADRLKRVWDLHRELEVAIPRLWQETIRAPVVIPIRSGIVDAEGVAISKSAMEIPVVAGAGLGGARPDPGTGVVLPSTWLYALRVEEARLDTSSCALVRRLAPTDWGREPRPLVGQDLERVIAGLEGLVAADTQQNELQLHASIHRWFASASTLPTFEELNERLYRELFRTPKDDPWLGLSSPGTFTGLPHDGVAGR